MNRLDGLPRPLRTVVLLLAAEAAALAVGGVYVAVAPLSHDIGSVALTESEAVIILAAAVLLGVLARALAGVRRWARSPAVLTQLLAIPVGVSLLQVGMTAWGALVVAVPALVLLLLLGAAQARAPWEQHDEG